MDDIKKPQHYQHSSGIECKDITKDLSFVEGNIFKYIFRAGRKGVACIDYAKAAEYCMMLTAAPANTGIKGAIVRLLTASKRRAVIVKIETVINHELDEDKRRIYQYFIHYLKYNSPDAIRLIAYDAELLSCPHTFMQSGVSLPADIFKYMNKNLKNFFVTFSSKSDTYQLTINN